MGLQKYKHRADTDKRKPAYTIEEARRVIAGKSLKELKADPLLSSLLKMLLAVNIKLWEVAYILRCDPPIIRKLAAAYKLSGKTIMFTVDDLEFIEIELRMGSTVDDILFLLQTNKQCIDLWLARYGTSMDDLETRFANPNLD